MQRDVLAPPHPHPQLQPFQAVETTHSFLIHGPSFSSEQHPDPRVAKARTGVSELAYPQLPRSLVTGRAASIPCRPAELSEVAGPLHLDAVGRLKPGGQLAPARGPQTFFLNASASMCLSSVRSATNRFSRLFSSSSDRSLRSSLTPRWAYFFFQM